MKKNARKTLLIASFILGCVLGGMFARELLSKLNLISTNNSTGEIIVLLLLIVISLLVSCLLAIIIHEGGHLAFGLLSGYKYLLFRVGSLTLIRRNNKFEFKKFSIKGTGGQCILMPPESDDTQNVPFLLYHAGGGLFNLITAITAFPIAFNVENTILRIFLLVFGSMSFFMVLTNLIPLIMQVPNDGYNIMMMLRKPSERTAIYKMLKVNGLLFNGLTPSQIPNELNELGSEGFYKTAGNLFKGGALIDSLNFEEAEKLFYEGAQDDTIPYYQLESRSELMFCKIINNAPSDEIDVLYNEELSRYISNAGRTFISKRRQMYAYYLLYKHDSQSAEKEYQAAMKLKETYPIEGEVLSELKLLDYIKKRGELKT